MVVVMSLIIYLPHSLGLSLISGDDHSSTAAE